MRQIIAGMAVLCETVPTQASTVKGWKRGPVTNDAVAWHEGHKGNRCSGATIKLLLVRGTGAGKGSEVVWGNATACGSRHCSG